LRIADGGDTTTFSPLPYGRAFGAEILVLGLDKLIGVKRAAGRPKDLEVIAELEARSEEVGTR